MSKRFYTDKDIIEIAYDNNVTALRSLASVIEKYQMERSEIVKLILEIADEQEAESMVINLKKEL